MTARLSLALPVILAIVFGTNTGCGKKEPPAPAPIAVAKDKPAPKPEPMPPTPTVADDRQAAEWMLRQGGRIGISANGQDRMVDDPDQLPKASFTLTHVNSEGKPFTDADLEKLAGLQHLAELELFGTKVTDAGLVHLQDLPRLTSLRLDGTQVTGPGVVHLKRCKLWQLGFDNTPMTDVGLAHVAGIATLTHFYTGASKITDAGLKHLAGMTNLVHLSIDECQVTDAGLAHLKALNLGTLDLSGTQVTDDGLVHLRGMSNMDLLLLHHTKVGDAGVDHLKGLTNLNNLQLNDTQLTDAGMAHLKDLKKLQALSVTGTKVSDKGLEHVHELKELVDLGLDRTQVGDAGLIHLKGMPKLRIVSLVGTKVTDAGLMHLKGESELRDLFLEGTKTTDAGIADLKKALPKCQVHKQAHAHVQNALATRGTSNMKQLTFAGLLVLALAPSACAQTKNWPQFRGPQADGLGEGATLPETWSTTENVVWKADLPGWGWSSPVIWDKRIFVTAAVHESARDKIWVGGYPGGQVKPTDVHRWMTYCLDFDTGKILWQREAHKGLPPQARHPRNSYASETPICDGARLYVYFANIGAFCYDLEGQALWEKRWDSYPMRGGWGTGTSPVLHQDRLFIVNDNETESFMVALDKTTGKQLWRVPRAEKSNWATPYVWQNELRTEIVTIGTAKARSYDLEGKVLWELAGTSGLVSQIPMSKHGLLYLGAGYHYGPLYAIRPGAAGDISLKEGEKSNQWIAWSQPRGSSIHPGYLISDDRLYVLFDAGLLTCFDAKTGATVFPRERLDTGGGRFYASPWAYHGKLFLLNEDGTTWVVEDSPKFNVLHKNSLDDFAWATPAIARGSLFIRTYTKLYRLQKRADVKD